MNAYFDSYPEPSQDELTLLTAEEYIYAIGQGHDPDETARKFGVDSADLLSEIEGQLTLIDELVSDFNIRPDAGLDLAIEDAKLDLGHMLVDKGNLPGF